MADLSWHQNRVRGGDNATRGGQEQFKWDSIKNMNFKDREQYLGGSTMIGMQSRGGKFSRQDWYAH